MLLDNAFGWGDVVDPSQADNAEAVRALVECAERLGSGERWRATMIPTGEGLAFAVKVR